MDRFPTVRELAAASEEEVVKAWEGLGYYRRARHLHAAARAIVREHGGKVPSEPGDLRALPGVGRYIAGAVASIAFDRPEAIVEANTERVLSRLIGWGVDLGAAGSRDRLWRAAGRLVPPTGAGQFNQGLMELGQRICLPRSPRCLVCPIAVACTARGAGIQEALPRKAGRAEPAEVREACVVVERGGRFLVGRRGEGGLWAGFWEFPTAHVGGADPAARRGRGTVSEGLAGAFRRLTGLDLELGEVETTVRFGVTRYRVALEVRRARAVSGNVCAEEGYVDLTWATPAEVERLTMGAAQRRVARWAEGSG
jgi:A/G-specific adenine glycosylase